MGSYLPLHLAPRPNQFTPLTYRHDRVVLPLLCLGLGAIYLAVSPHAEVAYDANVMIAVTRNLFDHFTLTTTGAFIDYLHLSTPYSPYGLGMSLLAIPAFALARLFGHEGFIIALINPLIMTATAAVVYKIGRQLAWEPRISAITAIGFGTLTMALQSTTEFFSEPAVGLCSAVLVWQLLRWRGGSRRAPILIGLALAMVIQFRSDSLLTVWIGALTLPLFVTWSTLIRLRAIASLVIPVMASVSLYFWYNEYRYGKLIFSSYDGVHFNTPLLQGVYGLLLSPGKGLFIYNPLAILGGVGILILLRKDRALGILALALIVPRTIFFAKWGEWAGGICWGPRFLMPVVFLFSIGATVAIRNFRLRPMAHRAAQLACALLAVAATGVSVVSVWVPYEQWGQVLASPSARAAVQGTGPRLVQAPVTPGTIGAATYFTWRASDLVGNLLLIDRGMETVSPVDFRHGNFYIGWSLVAISGLGLTGALLVSGRDAKLISRIPLLERSVRTVRFLRSIWSERVVSGSHFREHEIVTKV